MTNPPTLREALRAEVTAAVHDRLRVELDRYTTGFNNGLSAALTVALQAIDAALAAQVPEDELIERCAKALEPFAEIGVWLFARDLPDETPVCEFERLNQPNGVLTRGHFKAAHTAVLEAAGRIEALGSPVRS